MKLCEAGSPGGETIDIRRRNVGVAGQTEITIAEVIDQDEDDIRLIRSGVCCRGQTHQQDKNYSQAGQ